MTFSSFGTPLADRLDPDALARLTEAVRDAAGERLAVRAAAPRHPLTIAGLLDVTGIARPLGEHLMHHQSRGGYCECAVRISVERCVHAVDLGL